MEKQEFIKELKKLDRERIELFNNFSNKMASNYEKSIKLIKKFVENEN